MGKKQFVTIRWGSDGLPECVNDCLKCSDGVCEITGKNISKWCVPALEEMQRYFEMRNTG